ncbi:hypothetical protein TWF481_001308 [Arthrobotrys musiformis]|uniref:Uncharacterized protein n=1 Tax=Arthrobotrys musiformis TaxID=47236 RepID=A0AAV9WQ68_9PEZI
MTDRRARKGYYEITPESYIPKSLGSSNLCIVQSIWPATNEEDPYILLKDLYGPNLPEDCDGNVRLPLRLSVLRHRGQKDLESLDLVPSTYSINIAQLIYTWL